MLVVLSVLSACDLSAPSVTQERVTISFAAPRSERPLYEAIVAGFEQANPNIHVQLLELEDILAELNSKTQAPGAAMRATVHAADTALVPNVRPDDIASDLVQNLRPFIDADATFQPSDYYTGTLEAWSQSGAVYGLPRDIYVPLLAYNKELWSARGIPPPSADWSWHDLLDAAQRLTQSPAQSAPIYGVADDANGQLILIGSLFQANPATITAPLDQVRLDAAEVEAALNQTAALVRSKAIYGSGATTDQTTINLIQLIRDQRIAMWRYETTFTDTTPPFTVGVVPMPALPKPLGTAGNNLYIMSCGTQHPEAAWRWLSFLSRQTLTVAQTNAEIFAARRSLAEQSSSWKNLPADAHAALVTALRRRESALSSPAIHQEVLDALDAAWRAVLEGKLAHAAAREAQAALDQTLAQQTGIPTLAPDHQPFVVAAPPPETAPPGVPSVTFAALSEDIERIRPLAKTFRQQHPEPFLELKQVGGSGEPVTFAGLAASADCFIWHGAPPTEQLTATLDVQPLLDADATLAHEFPAALLVPYRREGELHGLPYVMALKTLSYNPRLFAEAGLEPPSIRWTLDDLLTMAQALRQGNGTTAQYGYVEPNTHTVYIDFFLDLFGAAIGRNTNAGFELRFTDPKVVQALTYYVRLLRDTSPHRRILNNTESQSDDQDRFLQLLKEGRGAMWLNLGSAFYTSAIDPDQLAVAPLPLAGRTVGPGIVETSGFYISARTTQPQTCWSWFQAFSDSLALIPSPGLEGQTFFPVRRSAAESPAFTSQAAPGTADVYQAYMEALARTPASLEQYAAKQDPSISFLYRAVDRALQGADLDQELAKAQRVAGAFIACLHTSDDRASCARQADQIFGN